MGKDLDLGLAYGLAHQGDRHLVLVLPAGTEGATCRRIPWLDVPVTVFTYDDTHTVTAVPPRARAEVLDPYTDALVTESHALGDREAWVANRTMWRQWGEARAISADVPTVTLANLPAEQVLSVLAAERAAEVGARYDLT